MSTKTKNEGDKKKQKQQHSTLDALSAGKSQALSKSIVVQTKKL